MPTHWLSAAACVLVALLSLPASADDGIFLPAAGNRDMVYDAAHRILYVTGTAPDQNGTSTGALLRFDMGNGGTALSPILLGGDLFGIDLSPDGTTLAVADDSSDGINGWIDLVNVATETVTRQSFSLSGGEKGAFSVAYGADARILVTTSRLDSLNYVPLRKFDPATGSWYTFPGSVYKDSLVAASGDRTVIAIEGYSGGAGRYRVSDGSLLWRDEATLGSYSNFAIAPNRDASSYMLLGYAGGYVYGPDLTSPKFKIYPNYTDCPPGAAFNPAGDTAFVAKPNQTALALIETQTWNPIAEFNFSGLFYLTPDLPYRPGWIRAASDGTYAFVNVSTSGFVTVSNGVQAVAPAVRFYAYNQSVATPENKPLAITLSAGFWEGRYTYEILTNPTHGTLSATPPNVTYTPAQYYNGSDSFTFRARAGNYTSTTGTVSITITNTPPVAVNDSATTKRNTAKTIAVLANDYDPDGDPIKVASVSKPPNGTATLNANGTVKYTPRSGYTGTDQFTYTVTDNKAVSSPAIVTVTITK